MTTSNTLGNHYRSVKINSEGIPLITDRYQRCLSLTPLLTVTCELHAVRCCHVSYRPVIASRLPSVYWHHCWWPWVIFHNAMTIPVLWCYKPADGMWCWQTALRVSSDVTAANVSSYIQCVMDSHTVLMVATKPTAVSFVISSCVRWWSRYTVLC